MEVSGQLHAAADLPPRKEPRVRIVGWTLWKRENLLSLPGTESFLSCPAGSQASVPTSLVKKEEVNCTLVHALRLCRGRTAHKGSRGIALLFLDHGTRRGEGSASRPGLSLPPGKTQYPFYMSLGGPQGRSGRARKISPPPGFEPRTVQPVASRYTDYATRPTNFTGITVK